MVKQINAHPKWVIIEMNMVICKKGLRLHIYSLSLWERFLCSMRFFFSFILFVVTWNSYNHDDPSWQTSSKFAEGEMVWTRAQRSSVALRCLYPVCCYELLVHDRTEQFWSAVSGKWNMVILWVGLCGGAFGFSFWQIFKDLFCNQYKMVHLELKVKKSWIYAAF